jgi:hypothetical protein
MSVIKMNTPSNRYQSKGRYRYRAGQPLDPFAELHPEMNGDFIQVNPSTPTTIQQLLDIQQAFASGLSQERFDIKVETILSLVRKLEISMVQSRKIALTLIEMIESFHDEMVQSMIDNDESERAQIAAWAIDSDRLMRCRDLLQQIEL